MSRIWIIPENAEKPTNDKRKVAYKLVYQPGKRVITILGILLGILLSMNTGQTAVLAADDISRNLLNGSFEDGQTWEAAYKQMDQSAVPYWNTTAYGSTGTGSIELFRKNTGIYINKVTLTPTDGSYAAELNADEESTLYQVVKTYPASVYEWGLDHGARNSSDTMALIIGPKQDNAPSKPNKAGRDHFMQMVDWLVAQGEVGQHDTAGLHEQITLYSKKFGPNGTFLNDAGNHPFSLEPGFAYTEEWHIWIITDCKAANGVTENPWSSYGANADTGSENETASAGGTESRDVDLSKYYYYTVPAKQDKTLFAFVSVGYTGTSASTPQAAKTYGNFLDNIQFTLYHPFSGSSTTHGDAVIMDSAGSVIGGTADGGGGVTYVPDGSSLTVQAVLKKQDIEQGCEFVGVYNTYRNSAGNLTTDFLKLSGNCVVDNGSLTDTEKAGKWVRTTNGQGDFVYTYKLENVTSGVNLHFLFVKNPTITYDANGGSPYITGQTHADHEAENVYTFKPKTDGDFGVDSFIPPYTSHAATGLDGDWKFVGWKLTGDTPEGDPPVGAVNPEGLDSMILPTEHTVACDYMIGDAGAPQFFKFYNGAPDMDNSLVYDFEDVIDGIVWMPAAAPAPEVQYANSHKGLTMVAQWRWRLSFLPQVRNSAGGWEEANTPVGTIEIADVNENDEYLESHGYGTAYFAGMNQRVTVMATPAEGYVFDGWYDEDGALLTTAHTYIYDVTSTGGKTCYARFSDKVTQTYRRFVRAQDEAGAWQWVETNSDSVGKLNFYTYTDAVGAYAGSTATAGTGYRFVGWYDGNGNKVPSSMLDISGTTIRYPATSDGTYDARFMPEVSITVTGSSSTVKYDGSEKTASGYQISYKWNDGSVNRTDKPSFLELDESAAAANAAISATNAGEYVMPLSAAHFQVASTADWAYTLNVTPGKLTIQPREITITIKSQEKIFGADDPSFDIYNAAFAEITGEGILENDKANLNLQLTRTNSTVNAIGQYEGVLTATYNTENKNYLITVTPGKFTINSPAAAGAMLIVPTVQQIYDSSKLPLKASVQFINVDESNQSNYTVEYSTDDGSSWTTDVPSLNGVGKIEVKARAIYQLDLNPGPNSEHTLTSNPGTIEILPKPITIEIKGNTATKTYNGGNQSVENFTVVNASAVPAGSDVKLKDGKSAKAIGPTCGYYYMGLTNNDFQLVGDVARNYAVTWKVTDGWLYIKKSPRTIQVQGFTGGYDGMPHSAALVNQVNGDNVEYSLDQTNWSAISPKFTDVVDTPAVVYIRVTNPNYEDVESTAVVTIETNPVTIRVADKTMIYDAGGPTLTGSITSNPQLAEAKLVSDLQITYYLENSSSDRLPGTYPGVLKANYVTNKNYTVTVVPGELTVQAASIDGAAVTASGGEKYYDGTPLTVNAQLTSNAADYTIEYWDVSQHPDTETWTTDVPSVTNATQDVKTVRVRATRTGYQTLTCDPVTIQVKPLPIAITVNNAEKVFGQTDPAFTGEITSSQTLSEAQKTQIKSVLNIAYFRKNSESDRLPGTYTEVLTASYDADNKNYAVTVVPGNFTIHTATVSGAAVEVLGGSKVYDGTALTVNASVTGATDYKIWYSEDNRATWQETAPSVTNVADGVKTVYVKATRDGHETLTCSTPAEISIRARAVNIQVQDAAKDFDAADPSLQGTVTGDAILGTDITIRYYRTNSVEEVGTYPGVLTADCTYAAGVDRRNYVVTVAPGKFTIQTASVDGAVVTASGGSKTYDGTALTVDAGVTGAAGYKLWYSVDDRATWQETAPSVVNVADGVKTVYVKATRHGYVTLTREDPVSIQIQPRPITVSATNEEKFYDGTELTGGFIYTQQTAETPGSGLVSGQTISAAVSGSQTGIGQSPNTVAEDSVVIRAGDTDATANYTIHCVDGTLTVKAAINIAVTASPAQMQVNQGQDVVWTITVENRDSHDACGLMLTNTLSGAAITAANGVDPTNFNIPAGGAAVFTVTLAKPSAGSYVDHVSLQQQKADLTMMTLAQADAAEVTVRNASSSGGGTQSATPVLPKYNTGFRGCNQNHTCPLWPYTDMDADGWYHDGIHFCLENGLMRGYSDDRFQPNASTTRAMITVMLWRLNGSPVVNCALDFEDVQENAWYTEAIRWAKAQGIANGYGNGKFGPDNVLTREQMASILFRYTQFQGGDLRDEASADLCVFDDAATVSEYAVPAMQWAYGSGVIQGMNAANGGLVLKPNGSATRAQMATMMMRYCTEVMK